jgi:uncharacterized protein (DUF58 family)
MVFDGEFLKRLEALRLSVRHVLRGRREGERAGPRPGGSSEFHSHRTYAQGDDFRSIDWSLYARLGALFVRERIREEAPSLHMVLDTSPSMDFGFPSKADLARRLAAALGYLVTGEGGDATLWTGEKSRTFRGEGASLDYIRAVEMAESGAPVPSVRRLEGKALVVVASDLWDEALPDALAPLPAAGHQLTLLHLLAPEELAPSLRGLVRFVDAETGDSASRYIGEEEVARYAQLLREHCDFWRKWTLKREAGYVRCASDEPFDKVILLYLRGEGVLE